MRDFLIYLVVAVGFSGFVMMVIEGIIFVSTKLFPPKTANITTIDVLNAAIKMYDKAGSKNG